MEGGGERYKGASLRRSLARPPFDRVNTGDNTPAVIHVDIVPGAELKIMVMAKGGGCENRSKYKMLTPAEGIQGVKDWILECIRTAGPDAFVYRSRMTHGTPRSSNTHRETRRQKAPHE